MRGGKESTGKHIVSGNSTSPTPRSKIDLRDGHAIRREVAALYRDARAGRIGTQDATRLAYILDVIRRAYETSVLQARLGQYEKSNQQKKD